MSCMLRIGGETLDIDALLSQSALDFYNVWRKGEPRNGGSKVHARSGATMVVSNAEFEEFDLQVKDAIAFLELHGTALAKVASLPGADHVGLDFAVSIREGFFTLCSYLPPRLIQLAALAGIGIEISHYPCSDDDEGDA